jgi:predicted MFS family arabinose efflux permease
MPFLMIVSIACIVGAIIMAYLKPIDAHLALKNDRNPFHHLWITVKTPRYLMAFCTTSLLSLGGYMLMPFGSAFTVHNLGIELEKLPIIYLISGCCAIFIGPMVGKASDAFGKFRVYCFGAALSVIMVLIYTNLGVTPLALVALVNAVMFVGIFSRMIPAQALMSAIPEPSNRGSFMAINSSVQQMAGGFASVVAGLIVVQSADGKLERFNVLGYILVFTTIITTFMMYFIHRIVLAIRKNVDAAK